MEYFNHTLALQAQNRLVVGTGISGILIMNMSAFIQSRHDCNDCTYWKESKTENNDLRSS